VCTDSQDETVAIIDWEHGWCKALGMDEVVRSKEAAWLLAWVKKSLSEIEESSEVKHTLRLNLLALLVQKYKY
jgi:hypothetical protein